MTKLIIVKMSSIGDILQTISPLSALKKSRPDLSIAWVVENRYRHLVDGLEFVDKVIGIDSYQLREKPSFAYLKQAIQNLRQEEYDLALDFQGNLKSCLIFRFIRAKEKVGFDFRSAHEKVASFFLDKKVRIDLSMPMIEQNQNYLSQVFETAVSEDRDPLLIKTQKEVSRPLENGEGRFFVTIGTRWENKKLSLELWIEILKYLHEKYKALFYLPYSSLEEEAAVDAITKECPFAEKFPKCDLISLQHAFAKSKGVIGVDSALIHLAALTKVPIFSFFGPSSLKVYGPQNGSGIQGECPIGKTFIKRCPYLRTCPHGDCLKKLEIEKVQKKLDQFFQGFNRRRQ